MMDSSVVIFPGVGSNQISMDKDLYDNSKIVRDIFEQASNVLNENVYDLCFDLKNKDKIKKMENGQFMLLTLHYALYKVLSENCETKIEALAGYSLGEYAALCSAGVLSFPDTLKLIKMRQEIIAAHSAKIDGDMLWVMEIDSIMVQHVCTSLNSLGKKVYVSAHNADNHSTISGTTEALKETIKILEDEGALIYPLKIGGPFHSPLMNEAAKEYKEALNSIKLNNPKVSVLSNVYARPYESSDEIKDTLVTHLISPIQWKKTIEWILEHNVNSIIEMGPSNVMSFISKCYYKRISFQTFNRIEDLKGFYRSNVLKG
ncbi:ACP S-malonyltransferase [Haloimpatiens massiliensis]|uniref:ACP S-malonyltransferase n=1 Tax=Haloimpatiens massiliensis TaxID=1658110 RepID=UPI000C82656B|nr:ACP S-malonyltransferase [Haloimpatiens massiliensis]